MPVLAPRCSNDHPRVCRNGVAAGPQRQLLLRSSPRTTEPRTTRVSLLEQVFPQRCYWLPDVDFITLLEFYYPEDLPGASACVSQQVVHPTLTLFSDSLAGPPPPAFPALPSHAELVLGAGGPATWMGPSPPHF